MLPYQAVAMDYAVASAGFHHHQRPGGLPGVMGLPGPGAGLNPGLNPAFTHSWFVQTSPDICRQQQASNQSHLEPGILELRKEKSRDAARSRRGKENYEFYELAKMLPLPAAITSQLDKASIIRLTISYLKLRDFSGHGDPPWSRDPPPTSKALKGAQSRRTPAGLAMELFEQHQGTHILQSLDGFALSVAADGRFLYISETVSIYLGLSQILTALNFYARGSYQGAVGLSSDVPMAQQTVSRCLRDVTNALNSPSVLRKYIKFPQNESERNVIKRQFYEKYRLPGVIGCIDCTHVAIVRPTENEERFFNRKHYHSLNVQVICDAHLNILNVDASYGGATHDSFIWSHHEIKAHLESLQDEETVYLLGDSGYPLREYMMTPIDSAVEDSPEGRYNRVQKRARSTIERTFGVLKGRWRCLLAARELHYAPFTAEMTGSSIFDYVHQADHAEIAEQLGLSLAGRSGGTGLNSPASGSEEGSQHGTNNPDVSSQMSLAASGALYRGMDRAFCVRMKSTLTKRGCHFKSSGYRVVLMLCRLRPQYSFSHSRKSPTVLLGMVALAIALPPPSVHEIRLESDMFVTRINFDFRIAHCEPRVSELLGYTAEELTGKNLYALCHGEDANKLRKCHVDLMNKGQVLTHYYRIMNKLGGYTWMQTCATVVCSSKNAEEQNIICVNYVISGREYPNTVMDCCQLEESVQGVKREETTGDPENGPPDTDNSGGPPPPPRHQQERTEPPTNAESASTAPVPTSDVTHLTRLNDTQPLPLHNSTERTSPMPARRLKKRKHTTDEEEEREEERRKSSSNPGAAISPAERDITKTNLAIPEGTTDATSVRDLENAMSKHLPSVSLDGKEISHRPTDFSTDALLKQQQQKSTIQWIGTQNHHLNHLNRQIQGNHTSTPASALLRQLYANRESVIRSNFLGDGRTGGYYSSDGQSGPLPTPPGSEGSSYGEQLGHKGTDIGSLAYGGYADYHSAMTPPGSVSPRDKQQYALSYDNSAYSEALRHSYLGEAPLPLKPQAYSAVPGALDYASPLDQSQFFHPPSSFHLYHPQAHSAHATHSHQPVDKSAPPNTNWYSGGS